MTMNHNLDSLFRRLIMAVVLLIALPAPLPALATATPHAHLATTSMISNAATVSAASAPPIEFVDSFGGIIPTFAISGTIAFLIQGNTLTVLEISVPATPVHIGHMPLVWGADTLAVADGIVYVVGYGIVQIIDARKPALPVEITRFRAQGAVYHIQVVGSFAYLNEGIDGVEFVEISDLSRPIHRFQYRQSVCIVCFLVDGKLAYVANSSSDEHIIGKSTSARNTRYYPSRESAAARKCRAAFIAGNCGREYRIYQKRYTAATPRCHRSDTSCRPGHVLGNADASDRRDRTGIRESGVPRG